MKSVKKFSSKILLFGEHIVNKGANALALPYPSFYACLSFDARHKDFLEASSSILKDIYALISTDEQLSVYYDTNRLLADMKKGLCFHLNIPIGYGLGSSGAIVAAIFEEYALKKDLDNTTLKEILGLTEGVFHGKSSGLDPLVSYLNQAVLIDNGTHVVEEELKWQDDLEIFLIDTKQARKTGPLVNAFLEKANKNKVFAKDLEKEIIPLNNQIIRNFLNKEHLSSLELIQRLSALQFETMQELILPQHLDYWLLGLASKEYFLKICGAGGGGFMLGFTKDKSAQLPFEVVWI